MERYLFCTQDAVGSIPIRGSMEDDKILDTLETAAEASNKRKSLEELMGELETGVELTYAKASDGDRFGNCSEVTVVLQFSERGFGFGEVAIRKTPKGVFVDTECMSLERVKKYLSMLVDNAVLDTDEDPAKHLLYNEVMGRRCGRGCPVCNPGQSEDEGESA